MSDLPRPRRPWDRTPPEDREYFDLLGPGLVAVLPPRPPSPPGAGGWQPPTGGAWVHVGAGGRVRAFSGKAEMGQGTRRALARVVAEQLAVPVDRVEVVLGDTDLCPWDVGTFGSRSMPDAAPALAAVAAGAHRALLDLASRALGRPPADLEVRLGEVGERERSGGVRIAELVREERLVVPVDASALPPPRSLHPVSAVSPFGHTAEEVVTGRRVYASDVRRPGMVHGVILWPPSYGARLASVELGADSAAPPITVVRTGEFVGAAAPSRAEAREALGEVDARWEEGPQPGEREIEEYLRTHPAEGDTWDSDEDRAGDLDDALACAPFRLEATYRTAYVAHVPLEPHCAVAEWTDSRLTVWVGTQTPFRVRANLARALGMPEDDVRVIVPPTGSGFGGKHGSEIALAASRLARAAGHPVRVAFDREEEFRHAYLRPMSIIDVRAAVDRDGRLAAWEFHNTNGGAAALAAPYHVPNRRVDNVLSRSPLPQGSYRALGANANNFARESAVDELARSAEVDPLEMRERNVNDERLRTVLRRVATLADWPHRPRAPGRGFGLAVGLEKGSRVATVAEVEVRRDRRLLVVRLVTAFEAGAVVDPENLRSQVEGAQLMALGGALFERIHFEGGAIRNPRLSQYRVPRFSDTPVVEVELVDLPDELPSGAGETPMISVAPAVANAVFDATGQRLRDLPLVPTGRVPARSPA